MKTLRNNKRNLLPLMNIKINNLETKMINSMLLSVKVNKASENKLNTGKLNSTISKDNMPIFNPNLRKKKLYGKANSNSLRNKKIKLREIKKRVLNNSKLPLINCKRLTMIANLRMSKITVWSWLNLRLNSRKRRKIKRRLIKIKMINSRKQSRDLRKKTKLLMKDLNFLITIALQTLLLLKENMKDLMKK